MFIQGNILMGKDMVMVFLNTQKETDMRVILEMAKKKVKAHFILLVGINMLAVIKMVNTMGLEYLHLKMVISI